MAAPLTYEFRLDAAETIHATRDLKRRQRFGWLERASWPALVGVTLVVLLLRQDLWGLLFLALVVLMLLAQGLASWVLRRNLRRAYRETPSLRGAQLYEFSDAGLTIRGGATTITLGWDSLVEVAETEAFLLIYYSKRCAYYLPKRVASDPPQLHQLRQLLRTELGPRAAGLQPDDE